MIMYTIFIIIDILCLLGLIAFCIMFIINVLQIVFSKDDEENESYDKMMRKWRKYFYGGK